MQKAFLDYAERAILLRRSKAAWRLGHGNPATYELLTGGGNLELMVAATRVLREIVEIQQKFVFLAGEPREALFRTIGQALQPMEYAIIGTLDERLDSWLHQERFKIGVSTRLMWDDESITPAEWIPRVSEAACDGTSARVGGEPTPRVLRLPPHKDHVHPRINLLERHPRCRCRRPGPLCFAPLFRRRP